MYAIFKSSQFNGGQYKLIGTTIDGEPFKLIDSSTGSDFSKRSHSERERLYFRIRFDGVAVIDDINDISNPCWIVDPDSDPDRKPRDKDWERRLIRITGYNIRELKREIKIKSIVE